MPSGDKISKMPWPDKFWARVNKNGPGGCWEWTGTKRGYAIIHYPPIGRNIGVHRLAKIFSGADVPDHLVCDHLCRNPKCVNPDHIEMVTHRVNSLRGTSPSAACAARTHCAKGHEYTADNTWMRPTDNRRNHSNRVCRICSRASTNRWLDSHRKEYNEKRSQRQRERYKALRAAGLSVRQAAHPGRGWESLIGKQAVQHPESLPRLK